MSWAEVEIRQARVTVEKKQKKISQKISRMFMAPQWKNGDGWLWMRPYIIHLCAITTVVVVVHLQQSGAHNIFCEKYHGWLDETERLKRVFPVDASYLWNTRIMAEMMMRMMMVKILFYTWFTHCNADAPLKWGSNNKENISKEMYIRSF